MIPRLEIHFPFSDQWRFLRGIPYAPNENEFLLNHARAGIILALQAARISTGSRVGIMAYNCHTVMSAVEQAGCELVFLDVTSGLKLDMEDLGRKHVGLSAIVVTHLFGVKNDVKYIRDRFPNLIIIEDCAHAYGQEELFGDFAVFSVGQGKFPSIGDGGILLVLNERFREQAASLYSQWPDYSSLQSTKLFLRLCVTSWMHIPFVYGWVTRPIKKMRGAPSGRESVFPRRMNRGVSAIFAIKRDRIHEMIASRKKNAEDLMLALGDKKSHAILGDNAFMLVLYCDDPRKYKEYFLQKGIEAETHFVHSIDWAKSFGYVPGSCPSTEHLVDHLLMIPTYRKI